MQEEECEEAKERARGCEEEERVRTIYIQAWKAQASFKKNLFQK